MIADNGIFILIILACLSLQRPALGASAPFSDPIYWGRYIYQAWCRLPCSGKINTGNLQVTLHMPEVTRNLNTYSNMKLLSRSGLDYTVENRYDMWPSEGLCSFQFQVQYDSGNPLSGYCTSRKPATNPTPPTFPPGLPATSFGPVRALKYLNSYPEGHEYTFQARCSLPCNTGKFPGTFLVTIILDSPSSNFQAYGNINAVSHASTSDSFWNVVNKIHIDRQADGLCPFDFQVSYPSNPIPSGTCAEIIGSARQAVQATSNMF